MKANFNAIEYLPFITVISGVPEIWSHGGNDTVTLLGEAQTNYIAQCIREQIMNWWNEHKWLMNYAPRPTDVTLLEPTTPKFQTVSDLARAVLGKTNDLNAWYVVYTVANHVGCLIPDLTINGDPWDPWKIWGCKLFTFDYNPFAAEGTKFTVYITYQAVKFIQLAHYMDFRRSLTFGSSFLWDTENVEKSPILSEVARLRQNSPLPMTRAILKQASYVGRSLAHPGSELEPRWGGAHKEYMIDSSRALLNVALEII